MVRLLCVLGESEAGVSRTWCVRSGLDVSYGVTRAGGQNDQCTLAVVTQPYLMRSCRVYRSSILMLNVENS